MCEGVPVGPGGGAAFAPLRLAPFPIPPLVRATFKRTLPGGCFLTARDSETLEIGRSCSLSGCFSLIGRKKKAQCQFACGHVFSRLYLVFGFHLSFSVAHMVMLVFMLCVVNFISLVIGHFLLEGHGGMVFNILNQYFCSQVEVLTENININQDYSF